ncbi:hypothetical protein ACI782_17165 [Geodermatophilus sp. SYSU D00703]
MAVDDVAAVAFTVETRLGPAEIRAAGRRAAQAGRTYMETTITETQAVGSVVRYVAHGPGGFVRQMALQVRWEETRPGRRRVHLTVGDHLVERPRFLGIPVGRATVPALPSARRFADALRAALTEPAPGRGVEVPPATGRWPVPPPAQPPPPRGRPTSHAASER